MAAFRLLYEYKNTGNTGNLCHLTISRENSIVIATEFAGNKEATFARATPHLAMDVCLRFGINPGKLIWIERYNRMSYESFREFQDINQGKESCWLVRFMTDRSRQLTHPTREIIAEEEMKEIYRLIT